jgi:hypothetical protein
MNKRLIAKVIGCACLTLATAAEARTSYDGPWNLVFVTQQGSCDPTYNFSVNINDGVVTHPNLVKFSGYVGRKARESTSSSIERGVVTSLPPKRYSPVERTPAEHGAMVHRGWA